MPSRRMERISICITTLLVSYVSLLVLLRAFHCLMLRLPLSKTQISCTNLSPVCPVTTAVKWGIYLKDRGYPEAAEVDNKWDGLCE